MGLSPSSAFLVPAATPDTTNSQQIGATAPKAASSWRTQTLSQALDEVLFPTIPPTYDQPMLSISTGAALTVEAGTSFSGTITSNWQQRDAGELVDWAWRRGSTVISQGTGLPIVDLSGSQTPGTLFTLRVNFLEGPQKNNNKGVPSGDPPGPGSIDSNGLSIASITPYYHLRSPVAFSVADFKQAIATDSATHIHQNASLVKVIASAQGTLNIPYNLSNQFLGVAHWGNFNAKTNFFVTTLDAGPILSLFDYTFDQVSTTGGTSGLTWGPSNFRYYITPLPRLNSTATIQLS